jgi:hypothetical protein
MIKSEIDWKKLKEGICPMGCGGRIKPLGLLSSKFDCEFCNFRISEELFDKIVGPKKRYNKKSEDNYSELNNLFHKEMSEDYSDEIKKI